MNILALVPAPTGTSPGQRFRIEQWAPHLEDAGFRVRIEPFETPELHRILYEPGRYFAKALEMGRSFLQRWDLVKAGEEADAVYLYREASLMGPALLERSLARRFPLVYDFDDPIWLPYRSPTHGLLSRLKFAGKTATICRLADVVTVGNRLLAEYARRHADVVRVLPSTIDLAAYPLKPREEAAGPVRLGWTGSHSTVPFLDLVDEPLRALAHRRSDWTLEIICHTDRLDRPGLEGRVVSRRWSAETEAQDLHRFDIGLAPFPDTGWTPWRCHGKVLQYMAIGIPVVASPIGILPDFIEDGVNGFFAASPQQWEEKLRVLMDDAGLRHEMGLAGRRIIEAHFSSERWADELAGIFRSLVTDRKDRRGNGLPRDRRRSSLSWSHHVESSGSSQ